MIWTGEDLLTAYAMWCKETLPINRGGFDAFAAGAEWAGIEYDKINKWAVGHCPSPAVMQQASPIHGAQPVYPDVIRMIRDALSHEDGSAIAQDFYARVQVGQGTYGAPLTYDGMGRDYLVDAYQEILDAIHYLVAHDRKTWQIDIVPYLIAFAKTLRQAMTGRGMSS